MRLCLKSRVDTARAFIRTALNYPLVIPRHGVFFSRKSTATKNNHNRRAKEQRYVLVFIALSAIRFVEFKAVFLHSKCLLLFSIVTALSE